MDIIDLFPTPVASFKYDYGLTNQEILFINNLGIRQNLLNKTSVDTYVLHKPIMQRLYEWINICVSEYTTSILGLTPDAHLKITQSWVNFSGKGESHHTHKHPNSYLSGVFFLKTNKDDQIHFHKSVMGIGGTLLLGSVDINRYNCDWWWLPAVEGELLIFPSSLTHSVPKVSGDQTRISLSFNTFPCGMLGNVESLNCVKVIV